MRKIFICMVAAIILAGCAGSQPVSRLSLTYPYVASLERQEQIRMGMVKVKTGMTPSEVAAVMGKTDLVHDLFERGVKDSKPIGYTWWYIIQRKTDTGSTDERAEKLVRVSFDLADKVTKVDIWGIDKPSDNN